MKALQFAILMGLVAFSILAGKIAKFFIDEDRDMERQIQ